MGNHSLWIVRHGVQAIIFHHKKKQTYKTDKKTKEMQLKAQSD